MTNQAAQTMPECTCRDNEGCTKPCDRKAFQAVPLSEELLIEAAILSGNTPQERRLQKVLKQAAAALSQTAGVAEGCVVVPVDRLTAIHSALSRHIGDTDPYVADDATDDEVRDEQPVFWAAQQVAYLTAAPAASGGDEYRRGYAQGVSDVKARPNYDDSGDTKPAPQPPAGASVGGGDPDALPDGTLSKSTVKRVTALAGASVSERARECPDCKGAGEVMQPVWTPDPQDGYDALGTCPRRGGNGSMFPQALQDLLYYTKHCLSAADEGVDYSTSREWLDAMTTIGVMKKTGRGKWAPSDQAQPVADALRALEQALTQPSDAQRERDLLAEAIANAGLKCGLLRKDIEGLTGPQLLMVCDDMAQALTQQRGEPLFYVLFEQQGRMVLFDGADETDGLYIWRRREDAQAAADRLHKSHGFPNDYWHVTPLYTTPQPSADAVRELVKRWRGLADSSLRQSGTWDGKDMCDRIEKMADELESLLSGGSHA